MTDANKKGNGKSSASLDEYAEKKARRIKQGEKKERKTQATTLVGMGKRHHLFHNADGEAFARVRVGDHHEVFLIGSSDYRDVLARAYYTETMEGANQNALRDAMNTLRSIAKYDSPQEPTYLRVGGDAEHVVIDMGDVKWTSIKVTANGWTVGAREGVHFRRGTKTLALPHPAASDADFSLLWKYVNVPESARVLVAAWVLGAFAPRGPYPILLSLGEQGTGKSFMSRTIKALTDPSGIPLRAPPRDEQDLLVSALNSWVLALDNMSGASNQLSDALCRLATGGSLAGRRLYTDCEEAAYDVQRPVILNGIDDLASRPDLAERCIHVELEPLTDRQTEVALEAGFREDAPKIMAAVLNGVVLALRDHATVILSKRPRMVDFAQWAAAGLPALGMDPATFMEAYAQNQLDAVSMGLESSTFATVLVELASAMKDSGGWEGNATQLLAKLKGATPAEDRAGWPRTAKGVGNLLRRLAPSLRAVGVMVKFDRTGPSRLIKVNQVGVFASFASHASQRSMTNDANDEKNALATMDENNEGELV